MLDLLGMWKAEGRESKEPAEQLARNLRVAITAGTDSGKFMALGNFGSRQRKGSKPLSLGYEEPPAHSGILQVSASLVLSSWSFTPPSQACLACKGFACLPREILQSKMIHLTGL